MGSSDKKVFTAEKIRTSEICGIDGELIFTESATNISGQYISGENIIITDNETNGMVDVKSGVFDDLSVGGVKWIARDQMVYAFRFGGPPIGVPSRLPHLSGTSPQLYTGLTAGTNLVFVENTNDFISGDQIIINPGGYYNEGNNNQEELLVTGVQYYPDSGNNCCNATLSHIGNYNDATVNHNKEREILIGDIISFSGDSTYYTVTSSSDQGGHNTIGIHPRLAQTLNPGHCICNSTKTLLTNKNLLYDYPTGTKVARKYARTKTTDDFTVASVGDEYWDNVSLLVQPEDTITAVDGYFDSSSYNHTITPVGDVKHSTDIRKLGRSSVEFDGETDWLQVDDTPDWDFGSSDWTIEAWVYPKTYSSTVLSKWRTIGSPSNSFILMLEDDGRVKMWTNFNCGVSTTTTNATATTSTTALTLNAWSHVAVQRRGNLVEIFINGVIEDSDSVTGSLCACTELFMIGEFWIPIGGSPREFTGNLDEVRVSKGIARYNSGGVTSMGTAVFTPSEATFSSDSNTLFLMHSDAVSTNVKDESKYTHTINVHGDTHYSSKEYKTKTASLYFDGTGDYLSIADNPNHKLSDTDMTLEFWYKFAGYSNQGDLQDPPLNNELNSLEDDAILTKGRFNQNAYKGWGFALRGPGEDARGNQQEYGHIFFQLCAGDGDGTQTEALWTTSDVDDGNWHHIAVTHEVASHEWKMYLDGKWQNSVVQNNLTYDVDDNDLLIGAGLKYTYAAPASYVPETGHFSNCFLQDIRITKGARRYISNFDPPAGGYDLTGLVLNDCISTCYDAEHLYLDVGTYSAVTYTHLTMPTTHYV